jgi:NADH:ubiquinone oxidoreductase subunit F (NADH-binding)
MAKQPTDMVFRVLQKIQAGQAEHAKRLERIESMIEEVRDGMIIALGTANHADIRQNALDKRVNDLISRVARLERKR